MKIPRADVRLPGGLVCAPNEVSERVVQEHVMKHVLGIGAVSKGIQWNEERWDELGVISEERRREILSTVAELPDGACGVPEITGRRGQSGDRLACYECMPRLAAGCADAARDVVSGYAKVTEEVLSALVDGVLVERSAFASAAYRAWARRRDAVRTAVVATFGVAKDGRSAIARVCRGDGVVVELYSDRAERAYWRTTYRSVREPNAARVLFDHAGRASRIWGDLSGKSAVSRAWWGQHGSP